MQKTDWSEKQVARKKIWRQKIEKNISYEVGIMTLIRISSSLAELGKWAEMAPPPPPVLVLPSEFHEFAYAVDEQQVQVANLSKS